VDIETLPPEQAGVDRPCARTEHRHADGEDREKDVNPGVFAARRMEREGNGGFVESSQCAYGRGPETREQKDAGCGGNQVLREGERLRGARRETGDREPDEGGTEAKAE
jgi:hypothetical protein